MSILTIVTLLTIVAVGTYFQTVTGFGLAMIVIGVSSGLEITSVAFIATVVSLISLVNSAVALPGHLKHIDWRIANTTLLGIVPSSVIGVVLLNYLSDQAASIHVQTAHEYASDSLHAVANVCLYGLFSYIL